MTVTAATTPTFPVGGRDILVNFTVTGAGNYLKGYFTDAPLGSAVKTELLKTGATRLPAFLTDVGKPWLFTSDKADLGGLYTLQVEQYTKGTSYGGGYQDSPAGFLTETLVSSSTVTILVGQKVTQKIGSGPDTATLTLFVVDNTVRATSETTHGFTSPLIGDTKSPKALTASLNAGVLAQVAGLQDKTTTEILGNHSNVYNDIFGHYFIHIQSAVYHANADNDNVASNALQSPATPIALKASVGELLRKLDQHMRNDTGGGTPSAPLTPGTGSGNYHTTVEHVNSLLVTSSGDTLDTFVALADLWRAFAGHVVNTTAHPTPDPSDVPAALPPLLNLHRLFLAELAKQSPAAPASVNAGVTALIHGAGFEEA